MDGNYSVLTITTKPSVASRSCQLLEEADIPVMLEHVEISYGPSQISHGYRLLVPNQLLQNAVKLLNDLALDYNLSTNNLIFH